MSFHSGRCPVSTSCRMGPMSGSFSCSVLRATGFQPAPATTPMARICLTSVRASTLWQWVHSSWQVRRERGSALLCFRPWRCSEVKLYSCRRWNQRAVCPSRFLKLMSQVSAEWSVRKWKSCPYRYLWECSSVLTMASSSRRVTHKNVACLCFTWPTKGSPPCFSEDSKGFLHA
jgi:hypothetical protein